jgi:hypothetical protein
MEPIEFPQVNVRLGETQEQYKTLPAFVDKRVVTTDDGPKVVPWSFTCCYELSDEEIVEIIANKRIFFQQTTFGQAFQPVFLSTKDPFIPENAEHWPPKD